MGSVRLMVNHPNRSKRPKWQPIETAPKDGTKIDLWAYWPEHDKSRRSPDVWWDGEVQEWRFGNFHAGMFAYRPVITHWMPLPDPPSS